MGTGATAVTPQAAEPDLVDDNGKPVAGSEPTLVDDNGHPLGASPLDDPNSVASRAALSVRNNRLAGMLPPPPPPQLPAVDAFFTGIGRGAVSTGTQIGKFVRGATTGDFGPYSDPAVEEQLHGSNPTSIDPQGGADTAGFYGEKLAELLAPAGLASRGAKALAAGSDLVAPSGRVLAEIPAVTSRLGRAALAGGAEGISNAAVTGLQTGDPHAAAWAGALGALTAAPLKYWSKAERVNALIKGVVDPTLAKPAAEAGAFVQQALADTRDAAGQALGNEYEKVANAATEQVSVGKSLPRIQELLAELKDPTKTFPGLGGVDDVNKAIGILQDFTKTHDVVNTGILDAAGNAITRNVPRTVSVEDALKLRSLLFKLSNSGEVGIGKGALQQLTQEWHSEIVNALNKQDPALAQQFTRASAQYRQFITTFNSQTIKSLINKGAPERVLDVLMSGGGETTATNLKQMIGARNMEVVRSSLWKRLLEQSSPGDSTFLAPKFDRMLDKLGPAAQEAVFGSTENVVKMRKFAAMMDTSWMHAAAKQSIGGLAIKAGAGAAVGVGADRVLEHDGAGGWKMWGPAGAAMALAPALVAKVLARPGTVDVLAKAMTTSPASAAGRALASKVSSLVMGVEMWQGGNQSQPAGGGGGGVDTKGVLGTLEAGDAARRARAGRASALVSGPPPVPSQGAYQSSNREFPSTYGQYDENDDMLMRREDAKGNELEFPVPIPPNRLLPERFKNTRNSLRWGSPLSGSFPERPTALGKYGADFEHPDSQLGPGTFANTVQIAKGGTEEPATYAHEVYHGVYERDLTPDEKQRFRSAVHAAWRAPDTHGIPQAVMQNSSGGELGVHESFAELGKDYMLNPSEFKAKYPQWYGMMRQFHGGKEYIRGEGAQK